MKSIVLPIKMIIVLWMVYIIDTLIPTTFNNFGIYPRTLNGLIGIPLAPFLHANLHHLINNTVPLFVLLSLTAIFFGRNVYGIAWTIVLIGGGLVWLLGRNAFHIGASGLIYGIAFFLIAFGIFKKKFVPLILSAFVALVYGVSMLVGLLPIFPGVSWEGHLFWAIAGILTAKIYKG